MATKKIKVNTHIKLSLSTGSGIASALTNIIPHNSSVDALYDELVGCEWDAASIARRLNHMTPSLYLHNWQAVRTTPRSVVVKGQDYCGNTDVLYVRLGKDEPDMFKGATLSVNLTNKNRIAFALSNIVDSRRATVADFVNYFYDVDTWTGDALVAAANKAYRDGVIYDRGWKVDHMSDDVCRLAAKDGFGNDHILIIKRTKSAA